MTVVFKMRTAGAEPQAHFTIDSGTSVRTYVNYDEDEAAKGDAVTVDVISYRLLEVLGTTNVGPSPRPFGSAGGRGSLDRIMPLADPMYLNCFADSVSVRVDRGELYEDSTSGAFGSALAVPPLEPGFAGYQGYLFEVNFASRPFAVLPNERMDSRFETFYDRDDRPHGVYYYPEWLRFVQRFTKAMDSRVSASVAGALQYYAPGTPADKVMVTGIPDMMIPDVEWRWRWYGVPARYLNSPDSWLLKLRGYVNQNDFAGITRGRLLYLGVDTVRTYVPTQFSPAPAAAGEVDARDRAALAGSFASDILLDLELIFIRTDRGSKLDVSFDPANPYNPENPMNVPDSVLANRNAIPAGHNLMPHFNTKRFYYAHALGPPVAGPLVTPDVTKWVPRYPSWSFACLFCDPDVPEQVIDL